MIKATALAAILAVCVVAKDAPEGTANAKFINTGDAETTETGTKTNLEETTGSGTKTGENNDGKNGALATTLGLATAATAAFLF